jgi:UDP-2,3-diacylglucosamine hydrolase
MSETLFIADLHLNSKQPIIFQQGLNFFTHRAMQAQTLYILGDLFETWIGDDDDEPNYQPILAALQTLVKQGVVVKVMHGNRDFLLGTKFMADTGCQWLPEPSVIDLYGVSTLIMHGDSLCTLDVEYQIFRQQVRNSQWQQQFLAQPLARRRIQAQQVRAYSQAKGDNKEVMDVTISAVLTVLKQFGVYQLIHGHTHRPAVHQIILDGKMATRWVVGDWREGGAKVLSVTETSCQLIDFNSLK